MNRLLTISALVTVLTIQTACTADREEASQKATPSAPTPTSTSTTTPAPAPAPTPAPVAAPAKPPTAPKTEEAPRVPIVGKLAPEIVGEDIDGRPMKLSDYRGKVVMLDFWGHW